jgi:hypothetical protein
MPVSPETGSQQPSGAQKMFGDFAPALVGFTDTEGS